MAFWWVNHKQTVAHEVGGSYLWSPIRNANGARNQSYDNMTLAVPGDLVFSFAHGRIGAVGYVTAHATPGGKPSSFGKTGAYWAEEGWYLPVEFVPVKAPLVTQEVSAQLAPYLPDIYSPIRANGMGNQGIYLAAISDQLGEFLLQKLGVQREDIAPLSVPLLSTYDAEISQIKLSSELSGTERSQLIQARVGQGLFRSQVLLRSPTCIVTGVSDRRVLRASHIKPWKDSSNFERLDGANGLTLSPNADALFDLGLLSFEYNGDALVRNDVADEELRRLGFGSTSPIAREFNDDQNAYLITHRERLNDVGFRVVKI